MAPSSLSSVPTTRGGSTFTTVTPALAVEGKVRSAGKVFSVAEVKALLPGRAVVAASS